MQKQEGILHLELGAANYGISEYESPLEYPSPELQLGSLVHTLDELVQEFGPRGAFFINDLRKDDTRYAANFLARYAASQGLRDIEVIPKHGSYFKIRPPKVKTMHLKHPDPSMHKPKNIKHLQRLATYSETGLELTIWYPEKVIEAFQKHGLQCTYLGPGLVYREECGLLVNRPTGSILIAPDTEFKPESYWQRFQDLINLKGPIAHTLVARNIATRLRP